MLGDNNVNLTDGPDIRGYNKTIRFPFDFSWPVSATFSFWVDGGASRPAAGDRPPGGAVFARLEFGASCRSFFGRRSPVEWTGTKPGGLASVLVGSRI